jgi:hypothetical protein
MNHPELVHGLELLPCAIRDGMLYIPHADGNWVSAAKLQPFSLKIIEYWRAEQVEASRSRAASEPGEVARLAEEARDLLLEALSAAESAGHPLNHGRSADANKARDELLAIIARLASAATSPASEALTPQQREDILVKAGAICDGGMSHDDFGLEIIDQVERHYGICAHGAGSISKS